MEDYSPLRRLCIIGHISSTNSSDHIPLYLLLATFLLSIYMKIIAKWKSSKKYRINFCENVGDQCLTVFLPAECFYPCLGGTSILCVFEQSSDLLVKYDGFYLRAVLLQNDLAILERILGAKIARRANSFYFPFTFWASLIISLDNRLYFGLDVRKYLFLWYSHLGKFT